MKVSKGAIKPRDHVAEVTMFGKTRRCKVEAYGDPLDKYEPEDTYWIEREEDRYGLRHHFNSHCVLTRDNWLMGESR